MILYTKQTLMFTLNAKSLSTGLTMIACMFPDKQVTAIQFEDGSGHKFNFQLDGGDWQFIDLHKTGVASFDKLLYSIEHSSGDMQIQYKRLLKDTYDVNYDNLLTVASSPVENILAKMDIHLSSKGY